MAGLIELPAGECRIKLNTLAGGWCQVSVLQGEQEFVLGADTIVVVTDKLLSAITRLESLPVCGRVDGIEVRAVMSLAEAHGTVYAARQGSFLALFFQDAEANLVAQCRVSEGDQSAWHRVLGPAPNGA